MPAATPGLADLSAAVLKLPIRQGENAHHSAVEDAAASLALAQYQIDHGTVLPLPPPELKVPPPPFAAGASSVAWGYTGCDAPRPRI